MTATRLIFPVLLGFCLLGAAALMGHLANATEPEPETVRAWKRYIELTEKRRSSEIESGPGFLVGDFLPPSDRNDFLRQIRSGGIFIRKMATLDEEGKEIDIPRGMVHHWYGAISVPGVELTDILTWVQSYDDSYRYYDEVDDSRLLSRDGDVFTIFLRLRRQKVITVHYNTEHEVHYDRLGEDRASSRSYATKIAEVENAGEPREREKPRGSDRGFLWRLNSYWRFQKQGDGVIVDCETVSLSRNIPKAMEWMIKSYLESVPRESLEKTLAPIRRALAKP